MDSMINRVTLHCKVLDIEKQSHYFACMRTPRSLKHSQARPEPAVWHSRAPEPLSFIRETLNHLPRRLLQCRPKAVAAKGSGGMESIGLFAAALVFCIFFRLQFNKGL